VVGPFCRSHPRTRLTLRFGHSLAQAEAVHSRELDLAYVIGWQIPPDVTYEALHTAQFTFLVAADHPLSKEGQVTVDDIAAAGLITAPLGSVEWTYYRRVLRECGLQDVYPKLQVDGIQARILAAAVGLGVLGIFCPPYAGTESYGSLVALPVAARLATVEMGLVTRRDGELSVAVKEFRDLLRAIAARASPA
jgi:DNA-binding transcriptional LysR family regulator